MRTVGANQAFERGKFGTRTGISWATRLYQSANARFWQLEIHEVNRDGPSRPIILAEAIKRKCIFLSKHVHVREM